MDCYKTLRIKSNATSGEIQDAAERMFFIWRPDDDDEFKQVALCVIDDIESARRTLLNVSARKKHDAERKSRMSKYYDTEGKSEVEIVSSSGRKGMYRRPWVGDGCLTNSDLEHENATSDQKYEGLNATATNNEAANGSVPSSISSELVSVEDTDDRSVSSASTSNDSSNIRVKSCDANLSSTDKEIKIREGKRFITDSVINYGNLELIEGTISSEISSDDTDATNAVSNEIVNDTDLKPSFILTKYQNGTKITSPDIKGLKEGKLLSNLSQINEEGLSFIKSISQNFSQNHGTSEYGSYNDEIKLKEEEELIDNTAQSIENSIKVYSSSTKPESKTSGSSEGKYAPKKNEPETSHQPVDKFQISFSDVEKPEKSDTALQEDFSLGEISVKCFQDNKTTSKMPDNSKFLEIQKRSFASALETKAYGSDSMLHFKSAQKLTSFDGNEKDEYREISFTKILQSAIDKENNGKDGVSAEKVQNKSKEAEISQLPQPLSLPIDAVTKSFKYLEKFKKHTSDPILHSSYRKYNSAVTNKDKKICSESALRKVSSTWSLNLHTKVSEEKCKNESYESTIKSLVFKNSAKEYPEKQDNNENSVMNLSALTKNIDNKINHLQNNKHDKDNNQNLNDETQEFKYENRLTNTNICVHCKREELAKNSMPNKNMENYLYEIEHSLNLSSTQLKKCLSESVATSVAALDDPNMKKAIISRHSESALLDVLAKQFLCIDNKNTEQHKDLLEETSLASNENDTQPKMKCLKHSENNFLLNNDTHNSENSIKQANDVEIPKREDDEDHKNSKQTPVSKIIKLIMDVSITSNEDSSFDDIKNKTNAENDKMKYIFGFMDECLSDDRPVSISVRKSKTISMDDGRCMKCLSILESEQANVDLKDESDVNARAYASFRTDEVWKIMLTSTKIETFSMVVKYFYKDIGEIIEVYAEDIRICRIVDQCEEENISLGNPKGFKEKEETFLLTSIIRVNGIKIVTTRVIGEFCNTVKVYKNQKLLSRIDNSILQEV